jgi:formate dehydrogenase iron-sulfur subunit
VSTLRAEGRSEARLYLADEKDNGIGGAGSLFLLLDEPNKYRLPQDPVVPTRRLKETWASAAVAAGVAIAGVLLAFGSSRR